MGKKEWQRIEYREQALALVDSGRPLTKEEIQYLKTKYSGQGGLYPHKWGHGEFFTPPNVVQFVHDLIGIKGRTAAMLEPSCGAGGFFEGLDPTICTGIEVNRDNAKVARACYPGVTIMCSDALDLFPWNGPSQMDGAFGYVVGNPPYGLTVKWAGEITGGKHRELKSEAVFLEIAYRACRPGGKIALVLSDGLLSNSRDQFIRDWIAERCFIRAVISLPVETFLHAGTSVKTSVLYLQRFPAGVRRADVCDYPIFMAICDQIGWDSRYRPTGKSDLPSILSDWTEFEKIWSQKIEWSAPSSQVEVAPAQVLESLPDPPATDLSSPQLSLF